MTKNNYSDNLSFKLTMIFSLFSLFVSNNLNSEYFYFACYGLILTFGIIHGANDILLLLKGKEQTNKIIISSTLKYLLIVVLISVLFFLFSEFYMFVPNGLCIPAQRRNAPVHPPWPNALCIPAQRRNTLVHQPWPKRASF